MNDAQLVAGHRVLRLLADGSRSRVWLAAGDRALKVLEPPVPVGQPLHEALALHRARGEHVVELLDLSCDDRQAVLVFPRLSRGSLADVVAAEGEFDAGEAVTALAPVATALARLHAAGVAHGAVSAANVLFRADGAPVLVGFGSAVLFDAGLPEVAREGEQGVIADRAGLARLAISVLDRVTGPRAHAAGSLAGRLRDGDHAELETRLASDLFDLAAARPVRLDRPQEGVSGPNRALGVAEVAAPDPVPPGGWRERVRGFVVSALETGPARMLRDQALERWREWPDRRRRLVLAGIAAVGAMIIALGVIPSAPAGEPVLSPHEVEQSPSPVTDAPALTEEDPLVALATLLDIRAGCLRELSVLCLDAVDEQGSAALDDDRETLRAIVDEGAQPVLPTASGATVVERLGDSVLIDLGPDGRPASVLLMKGEAGWRIRDYLD